MGYRTNIKSWWSRFYRQYEFWGVLLIVVSIGAIVAGIIISYRFYIALEPFLSIAKNGEELDTDATGMIGDFIGGVVGPLLSFVGVLLFFLALRLQSKELGLQIKELAETRRVFTVQQFESTFFNLLKTQQDIRLSLEYEEVVHHGLISAAARGSERESKVFKSAAFFALVKKQMLHEHRGIKLFIETLDKLEIDNSLTEGDKDIKRLGITEKLKKMYGVNDYNNLKNSITIPKAIYKVVFNIFGHQLGHYFRNLYHILTYLKENEAEESLQLRRSATNMLFVTDLSLKKYLNESQLNELRDEERKIRKRYRKYAAFVQAQMSSTELFLLFYNALFFPKMKALIHHFDFLENLNADDLLDIEKDKHLYDEFEFEGIKYSEVTLKSKEELLKIE